MTGKLCGLPPLVVHDLAAIAKKERGRMAQIAEKRGALFRCTAPRPVSPSGQRRTARLLPPIGLMLAVLGGIVAGGTTELPSANATVLAKLTANYEAKKNALGALPFDKLNETSRDKLKAVVTKKCIYRRLPTTRVSCDPQLHLFLVRYPEVVVNIWELMGISTVKLQRTGRYTFNAADGMGTTSKIELVYGSRKKHVLYVEAVYDGPLWPKSIRAKCVLLLTSKHRRGENGRIEITDQMDAFIHVENAAIGAIAKTLTPIFGKAADHNFSQSIGFLGRISETAQSNAPGIRLLAGRLTNVDPAVRQRFADISGSSTSLVHIKPATDMEGVSRANASRTATRNASGASKTDLRTLLRR